MIIYTVYRYTYTVFGILYVCITVYKEQMSYVGIGNFYFYIYFSFFPVPKAAAAYGIYILYTSVIMRGFFFYILKHNRRGII